MTDFPATARIMNKTLIHHLGAALIGASSIIGVAAHAALTPTGMACDGQSTGMVRQPGYLSCSGSWSGNNRNQSGDVASQVLADWGLTGLTAQDVNGGNSLGTGTLTFANQSGIFVLSLKAGDAFSLYEFNAANVAGGISSIDFDTRGVGFFSAGRSRLVEHDGQGLSHANLYSVQAPVPEPGIYALMFAGLGAVGFIARRRRA